MTPPRIRLVALLALAAVPGCPPVVQPPLADGGRGCATNDDCNPPGMACGERYLCVHQVCEAVPSQLVPCR